jgi:hypothetical protein
VKYRKKPLVIEAVQFDRTNGPIVAKWCRGHHRLSENPNDPHGFILEYVDIPTLEGVMTASLNDWIIKGVQGEFYPCKPDIFEQTYESVTEVTS